MSARLIVLGWDSATFDVAEPLMQQGRLPALKALCDGGFRAPLRSTWPPMTDCAWTSAFTGRNPGAHGIFGSWYRAPGAYACRYFSARDRQAPALWELSPGIRFLVWNVPMTFPPSAIEGVMVSGYGAPPGARICEPRDFQAMLEDRYDVDDLLDRAPHGSLDSFFDDLVRGLEVQAEALPWAIRESGADCVVAVWPHVDRAQHFFWKLRNTSHPLASAVDSVYEAMDRATGAVAEAFPDADLVVVSDHGAGTLKGDVNVGTWLVGRGRATYGRGRRSPMARAAWALPAPMRRMGRRIAPGLARNAFAATLESQLGPFTWAKTQAFCGVHSDLWLNLEGREPAGMVAADEADGVIDEIASEALALTDPRTGEALFVAAHRRDEIYSGPALALAPDLMLDSWSAGYRVSPGRKASELVIPPASLAGVGEAWSSDHRPLGIFAGRGPRIVSGRSDELSLYDVCPSALALLEQPVPEGLDGRVVEEALERGFLTSHPVTSVAVATRRTGGGEYSEQEASAVATHLKDLGYIE